MGFFKKLWGGVKKVGKIAQKAAPALAFIPGVGTAAALAIGGLGGLASGGWKGALKGAAGAGLGVLGKAGKLGKIGSLAKNALFSGGTNPGGFDLGDIGSIANAAGTALGAYGTYKGYKQSQADSASARGLTDDAVARANAEADRANALWQQMAPLRQGFISGVQGYVDPTNPFAQNAFNTGAPGMGSGGPGAPPGGGMMGAIQQAAGPAIGSGGGGASSPGMIAAMATPAHRRTNDARVEMA